MPDESVITPKLDSNLFHCLLIIQDGLSSNGWWMLVTVSVRLSTCSSLKKHVNIVNSIRTCCSISEEKLPDRIVHTETFYFTIHCCSVHCYLALSSHIHVHIHNHPHNVVCVYTCIHAIGQLCGTVIMPTGENLMDIMDTNV